jgi:hypothetical protein
MDFLLLLLNDGGDDYMTGGLVLTLRQATTELTIDGRLYTDRIYGDSRVDILATSVRYEFIRAGVLLSGDLNGKQIQNSVHDTFGSQRYNLREEEHTTVRPFIGIDYDHPWFDLESRSWAEGGWIFGGPALRDPTFGGSLILRYRYWYGDQLSDCMNSIVSRSDHVGVVAELENGPFLGMLSVYLSDVSFGIGWKF